MMAGPSKKIKYPKQKPWMTDEDFCKNPLSICFNKDLKKEEREWFNELLIAALAHKPNKISKFAKLLKDWVDPLDKDRLDEVYTLFFDIWELKMAFSLMLPNEAVHLALKLKQDELEKFREAYNKAVFTGLKYTVAKKVRMILTHQVEAKAIIYSNYKYVLYALYIYRTKIADYNVETLPLPLDSNVMYDSVVRDFCFYVTETGENEPDEIFVRRQAALETFIQHFKTYVKQVHEQKPTEFGFLIRAMRTGLSHYEEWPEETDDDTGALLNQDPEPKSFGGKYTPFQILLGNVCTGLFRDSMNALLEFKEHLFDMSSFAQVIINIGIEEGYIQGLGKDTRIWPVERRL